MQTQRKPPKISDRPGRTAEENSPHMLISVPASHGYHVWLQPPGAGGTRSKIAGRNQRKAGLAAESPGRKLTYSDRRKQCGIFVMKVSSDVLLERQNWSVDSACK